MDAQSAGVACLGWRFIVDADPQSTGVVGILLLMRQSRPAGSGAAAVAAAKSKKAAAAAAKPAEAPPVSPLERDIKEIAELLKAFMSRVMTSATSPA